MTGLFADFLKQTPAPGGFFYKIALFVKKSRFSLTMKWSKLFWNQI
jgi:hypothetical protein